jgi:ABC-type branched-subunit amino acid transport system ATPase component
MAYLSISKVNKSFGGIHALSNCSFEVKPLETTCVVGPNGAGKTSIFNVITGFVRPDSGRIMFKGEDITLTGRHSRVAAGIARTFQNLRLFETLTVLDNVMVCLADNAANDPFTAVFRPFHTHAVLARKRDAAMALLKDVGLAHKAHEPAANLSYGQKKLLCIARVLATGAELLLLDEPTSGLAAATLDNMVELIHRLKVQKKTLLIVEHNTRIVKRIADDVLFLHRGTLLARGTPDDIMANPDLGKIYFGEHA